MVTMPTALHVALLRSAVSLALVAGPLISQAVWSMGSPWTDLAVVIAAAAPGDIVLLNGLTFPSFALNKGLVIVGPGTIQPNTSLFPVSVTALTIPAGQHAHFSDVSFVPILPFFLHRVDANGSVTFDGCTFGAGTPASFVCAGNVLLSRCAVSGGPTSLSMQPAGGVLVQSGVCCITDSNLVGGDSVFAGGSTPPTIPASAALVVSGGEVLLASSTLTGGAGRWSAIFGGTPGAPAVVVTGGNAAIADCVLHGGTSPVQFTGPVGLVGTAATRLARSSVLGGVGNPPGASVTGPVQTVPQLVGLSVNQGFRLGQSTTITATAGGSQLLGILAGFNGTVTTHPAVIGPIFGSLSQSVTLTTAMPVSGGAVTHVLPVPSAAALTGVGLFVQAFQLDGAAVRASAGVGGVIH